MQNPRSMETSRRLRRGRRGLFALSILALSLSFSLPASGVDSERLARANRAINAQVARALRVAPELGVLVVEAETGAPVYSYRADVPRIAASNTKLVTTSAALDLLGPSWFFETPFLVRGRVEGGTLHGDLAVVGSGDPTFSGRWTGDPYSVFRRWALSLLERGVRRVEGDLFLAHGRFEGPGVHPDWPEDQRARWYQAPVSALTFSDNCVRLAIRPSRRGRPRIDLFPPIDFLRVDNATAPSSSPRRHRVRIVREPESSEVAVGGDVYRGAEPVEAWVTVPDPPRYFGSALRDALAERGIELAGRLRPIEHLPAGAWERLAVHRSDLLTTLEVTNRRSQNLFAETLLKTLGAEACGDGSWAGGLRAVEGFLERVGIAPGTYSMTDGSGLGRGNRFSPDQLVRLLRHMLDHRWGRELFGSLAVSGAEEQSLDDRLSRPPYRGNVHAKTGTLSGVSTLSGYARGRSGTLYVFSILANRTRSAWQARDAQDAILRVLIANG